VSSRTSEFLEPGYETEDGYTPEQMMRALEATLLPLLTDEKERIESELTFLKEVYSGITRGAPIETSSSIFVDSSLVNLLTSLHNQ